MTHPDTLLLACGTSESRSTLCAFLEDRYHILETATIEQARILLEQDKISINAVLLDSTGFSDSDFDSLAGITKNHKIVNIPVLVIASTHSAELSERIIELGAADLIPSPYSMRVLLHRLQNVTQLQHCESQFETMLNEKVSDLRRANETMVDVLASVIERRGADCGEHIHYVRTYTEILLKEVARACPQYNLTDQTIQLICSATSLHDIGKISVPESILNKLGPLTPEEMITVQAHTSIGSQIVQSLKGSASDEYIRYAYHICRFHHERWDGSGYPDGLSGDDIPICAQVVGLVDAYDALTKNQLYRKAFSPDQASNMILNGECGAFSPSLLECFKQVNHRFSKIVLEHSNRLEAEAPPAPLVNQSVSCTEDSMEALQSKYRSILYYLNASAFELDMDQATYHIIYNPDPNLSILNNVISFEQIIDVFANRLIVPEERDLFMDTFRQSIYTFWEEKLYCQTLYYTLSDSTGVSSTPYQVTFLRIDHPDSTRRRMLIICKRTPYQTYIVDSRVQENEFFSFTVMGIVDKLCTVCYDKWLSIRQVSTELCSVLGYSLLEFEEICNGHMIELVHPDDRSKLMESLNDQLSFDVNFIAEFRLRHISGHYIWFLLKGRKYTGSSGETYLSGIVIDISKSKMVEEILHQTLERQNIILSQTENVIFECDMDCNEIIFSQKWQEMFGYEPLMHDVKNRLQTESHLHPQDIPRVLEALEALKNGARYAEEELRFIKSDGYYLWCQIRITVLYDQDGEPLKMVGVIVNIDDKKRADQALQRQAELDPLSNLFNKGAGTRYVEEYLRSADADEGLPSALTIIDLDNFKKVNDKYGHLLGDVIITQISNEIRRLFRADDIISRIGGDEFMVLMKNLPSKEILERRMDSLLEILKTKLLVQVPESQLGCSMGSALFPRDGKSFQDLFRHADMALYQAKAHGKNKHIIYDPSSIALQNIPNVPERITSTPIDSDKKDGITANNLIRFTFEKLYESGNVEETIHQILSMVGQQLNISRVYIFENDETNTHCTNTFEWCNEGITSEIDNLQNLSYEDELAGYEKHFNEHGVFYCPDVSILPKKLYDLLEAQSIKSMLQCSIRDQGVFRGFVGFDECSSNLLWTQDQIEALRFFSEMLSIFLLKKRAQDLTDQRADNLSSILNKQNAWIYVIDCTTFEFKFLNNRVRQLVPGIREGMICYQALMHQVQQCESCPIRSMDLLGFDSRIIYNRDFNLCVHSEATRIQWNGEDAYLIICHQVDPSLRDQDISKFFCQIEG